MASRAWRRRRVDSRASKSTSTSSCRVPSCARGRRRTLSRPSSTVIRPSSIPTRLPRAATSARSSRRSKSIRGRSESRSSATSPVLASWWPGSSDRATRLSSRKAPSAGSTSTRFLPAARATCAGCFLRSFSGRFESRSRTALSPEPIRLPPLHAQLDLLRRAKPPVGNLAHELRKLFVCREPEGDEVRAAKRRDSSLHVGRQHPHQAELHLEPDDTVLYGHGHHARGQSQRDKTEGHDGRPNRAGVGSHPEVPDADEEVPEQDRQRDVMKQRKHAGVVLVILFAIGHRHPPSSALYNRKAAGGKGQSTNRYPSPTTVSIWRPASPSLPRRRPTCTSTERVSTSRSYPQTRSRSRSRDTTRFLFCTRYRRSSNSRRVSRTGSPSTVMATASKSASRCSPR